MRGYWECSEVSVGLGEWPMLCWSLLFPAVHSLNVVLVTRFQLLALELKCISHQSSLRSPWLWAQTDLARDLKAL